MVQSEGTLPAQQFLPTRRRPIWKLLQRANAQEGRAAKLFIVISSGILESHGLQDAAVVPSCGSAWASAPTPNTNTRHQHCEKNERSPAAGPVAIASDHKHASVRYEQNQHLPPRRLGADNQQHTAEQLQLRVGFQQAHHQPHRRHNVLGDHHQAIAERPKEERSQSGRDILRSLQQWNSRKKEQCCHRSSSGKHATVQHKAQNTKVPRHASSHRQEGLQVDRAIGASRIQQRRTQCLHGRARACSKPWRNGAAA
mmetsp:Transcript_101342/g.325676  ORF Transcript_101342/g.325676 Transcript_101342/m.325676 type:complete len:255 (+) Transcript_101342:1476-2240(+)